MEKFNTTEELNEFLKTVRTFGDLSSIEYLFIESYDMFLFETEDGLKVWKPLVEEDTHTIVSLNDEYGLTPTDDDLFCINSEIAAKELYLHKLKHLISSGK